MKTLNRGFTLIELMIVVAIIAIIASIAIAQYKKFQLKSKTAEAKANIGTIRACEETYVVEHDKYLSCSTRPDGNPEPQPQDWGTDPDNGFTIIGFAPTGKVYFRYTVFPGEITSNSWPYVFLTSSPEGEISSRDGQVDITIIAQGDLDGDGGKSAYGCTDENTKILGPFGDDF